jgi:hypothetical protein
MEGGEPPRGFIPRRHYCLAVRAELALSLAARKAQVRSTSYFAMHAKLFVTAEAAPSRRPAHLERGQGLAS